MIQFNIRVTSHTRCKSAKGTAFFAYKTTPLQFCTGVVQKRTLDWYEKGFRPLQFCTGVVPVIYTFLIRMGFRPLQFCTGVVRWAGIIGFSTSFRPLQFCTGVVQTEPDENMADVLDPCNFARV